MHLKIAKQCGWGHQCQQQGCVSFNGHLQLIDISNSIITSPNQ